jgi:serine/threonine protein kinase/tetratricopeptide (TPR) repeat protein
MAAETPSLDTIFCAAVEIAAAEDRAAYIARACGGDHELRGRVEKLVGAHFRAGSFLEGPAPSPGATGDFASLSAALPASAAPPERPGEVIGPYKLLEQIGEGGMGTVWVAEQQQPVRRRVALKLIKPGMDSRQVVARFEAERQALALMDHPNIAKVLDAGTTGGGRPFFVMEYVQGVPVTQYCDELHLSIRERLELFVPVCQAVQHAHQKGVIHRDLKPSNVLVAVQDGRPVPKVIDFGVAKALHTKLADRTLYTEIGAVIGTFEYMAPEQAELSALDIDTRADVYALGVLLYELLTGSTPLTRQRVKAAALAEVLRIIKEEEPPKPSTRLTASQEAVTSLAAKRRTEPRRLSAELRGELDWIVMRALEKDRTRRYETANGLARDIQRHLADEPVEARPASAGYRFRKFARRNRGRVTAAAVVLLALVGGVIGTTWQAVRARQAEAAARAEWDRAEAARARADRNFQKARAAVENYLQKVADNPDLKNNPNSHDLRKQLLAAALPFFEEFVREKSDDPQVRFDQGRAYFQLARVRGEMGEHEAAIRDYASARDIYARLAADFPAAPDYRHDLAKCYLGLGGLLKEVGKLAEAEAAWRRASAIQEKLVADFPTVPDYRSDLAKGHHNLGDLLNHSGKRAGADAEFRRALAIYETLAADFPAAPDYRNGQAASHHALGMLLRGLGKRAEAEAEFRRALAIYETLAADFPAVPEYRNRLARSLGALGGMLITLGRQAEAEAAIGQALAIQAKLVADFPAVPDYRNGLAGNYRGLGNLLRDLGRRAEAEAAYRQGLAHQEKLAAAFPAVTIYRRLLATSHYALGLLLRERGKRAEAEAAHRQGMALRETLAADFPAVPDYRIELASTYCNLGLLLHDRGESAAALDWYAKAIPLLEAALAQDSRVAYARDHLRDAYWARANALRRLARPAESVQEYDRALVRDDGSKRSEIRVDRAAALAAQTGDHARAAAEAEELTRGDTVSGGTLYVAAGVYALASAAVKDDAPRQESYAARAVALLRRAQAADYFNDGGHVEDLKTDPDFAALRGREDYRALLKELEAKK